MTETQTTAAFSENLIVGSNIHRVVFDRPPVLIPESDYHWRNGVIEQLQDLISLEVGWDGYRGEPVTFENANFALKVLEAICYEDTPTPHIVPGSSGDLQIEWHTHVAEIELHILAPNNVHVWIATPETGEDGQEYHLRTNFSIVAEYIKTITEFSRARTAAA